jgi:hypothetical protein
MAIKKLASKPRDTRLAPWLEYLLVLCGYAVWPIPHDWRLQAPDSPPTLEEVDALFRMTKAALLAWSSSNLHKRIAANLELLHFYVSIDPSHNALDGLKRAADVLFDAAQLLDSPRPWAVEIADALGKPGRMTRDCLRLLTSVHLTLDRFGGDYHPEKLADSLASSIRKSRGVRALNVRDIKMQEEFDRHLAWTEAIAKVLNGWDTNQWGQLYAGRWDSRSGDLADLIMKFKMEQDIVLSVAEQCGLTRTKARGRLFAGLNKRIQRIRRRAKKQREQQAE